MDEKFTVISSKTAGDKYTPTTGRKVSSPGFGSYGSEMEGLVSRYGKKVIEYSFRDEMQEAQVKPKQDKGVPPFVVIGLGRCGCHVSAELSEIIAFNEPSTKGKVSNNLQFSWMSSFFRSKEGEPPALRFEPIVLVGDIDETSFADVGGLLEQGGVPKYVREGLLQLNYSPLAEGGVGHVPIFAEFLTKAMLLLPTPEDYQEGSWSNARKFLTTFRVAKRNVPRLVFYIFSTGGGTGAGSAPEVMSAQSYAKAVGNVEREMYFTGTAILPQDITRDQRTLMNTGRTIIQYLADLNLRLDTSIAYDEAPDCKASSYIEYTMKKGHKDPLSGSDSDNQIYEKPMMPWNGLAFISNDVMAASSSDPLNLEEVESNANQYIAQQVFNLAAAQFPAAEFEKGKIGAGGEVSHISMAKKNYQAIRLDPNDLKSSLIGPYAVCFAAAPVDAVSESTMILDQMFLRALSLPRTSKISGKYAARLIEGISVAPQNKQVYKNILSHIEQDVKGRMANGLSRESFEKLREIPFFERAPRLIYSFTAPQKGDIPNSYKERLSDLLEWTFPNLIQSRSAISWGTTAFYSLSIYVETSVLLVPDIQLAVLNYLRLCWQHRRTDIGKFKEKYKQFLDQEPPIDDQEIIEWLGEKERYGVNIGNFESISADYNRRWAAYVKKNCSDPTTQERLLEHKVENAFMTAREVASAFRYLNYANHLAKPVTIEDVTDLI
jgi:hypothetical protein